MDHIYLNSVYSLGIDDQELPCLTATTNNIDDHVELVQEKPKKTLKRLKVVKF
jgi:hypothetical protein